MKKIILFLCYFIFLSCTYSSAQVGDWLWVATGEGKGAISSGSIDVASDALNNVIVVGKTDDTLTLANTLLAKQKNANNGFFTDYSMYVAKYNGSGNVLWAKFFEDNGAAPGLEPWQVVTDSKSNIYIYGGFADSIVFGNTLLTGGGAFLLKLDANGNTVWAKKLTQHWNTNIIPNCLVTDKKDNIYVAVSFSGTIHIDTSTFVAAGSSDAYIVKYGSGGQFVWASVISGNKDKSVNSVQTDVAGNIYLCGDFKDTLVIGASSIETTNFPVSGWNHYFAKLDSLGHVAWLKSWGSAQYDLKKMVTDSVGNMYIMGKGYAPVPLTINNTVLQPFGAYSYQWFVSKYNSAGNFQFAKLIGAGLDYLNVRLDAKNNLWFNGKNESFSMVLGNSNNIIMGKQMVVAQYNAAANLQFLHTVKIKEPTYSIPRSLAIDKNGDAYLAGYYLDSCVFGTIQIYTPQSKMLPFLAKLSSYPTQITSLQSLTPEFSVYPNPNNGEFCVVLSNAPSYSSLSITDQLGRVVHVQDVKGSANQVNIAHVNNGIYTIQLHGKSTSVAQKIVITK